jgi:hypothetical protein
MKAPADGSLLIIVSLSSVRRHTPPETLSQGKRKLFNALCACGDFEHSWLTISHLPPGAIECALLVPELPGDLSTCRLPPTKSEAYPVQDRPEIPLEGSQVKLEEYLSRYTK